VTPDDYAERALLGALLRDPRQIPNVQQLTGLQPADFSSNDHQILYDAILDAGQHVDLNSIDGWNTFRAAIIAHATRAGHDPQWLQRLANSSPRPDQATRYALMVIEGENRRAIIKHAQRIATEFTAATPQRLGQTREQITFTRTILVNLSRRWNMDPEQLSAAAALPLAAEQQAAPLTDSTDSTDTAPARSRLIDRLPSWMRRASEAGQSEQREQQLLAALVQDPQQLADTSWLRPEDFTAPHASTLYQALLVLTTRDEPIDAIAVLFEANRQGPIDEAIADRFIAACNESAPAAVTLARQVIEQSVTVAVKTQVGGLIDEVAHAEPQVAITTAVRTLTRIESTVNRYAHSRQVTTGDAHVYTPPDPTLAPPNQHQSAPSASTPA
jgi:replicative DNA helicase